MEKCQNQAEIQADFKIRYCKKHPEAKINGFCEKCREFFCKECIEDHMDHDIESLKKFCKERKKNVLSQISLSELSNYLKEKNDEITKTREILDKELKETNKNIVLKERVIKDGKEETFKEEIGFVESVERYLVELEDKASSITLRKACEDALELFDIEDEIKEEFETMEKSLEDAKEKVKELEKELEEVNEKINVLNYIKGNEKYEFDDDKWRTFLLLNERTPIFSTIDKFKAFPSVERVFDIEEVMRQRLVDLGKGIKISEFLKIKGKLMTGSNIFASLSHQGVLAIYARSCNKNTVQFIDLNNGRQVKMKVEDWTLIGFYDEMGILLTYHKPLREIKIEKVFENPMIETSKEVEGTSNVDPCTDVTLLNEKRVLYYSTDDERLFSFNVDTRASIEINISRKVWSIASSAGIDCNVKTVFQTCDDLCTYTLNNDDSVTKVNEKQDSWLTTVLPSGSNPKNISDAVFKYANYLTRGRNWVGTSRFIKFEEFYSVVRVYRDIFLVHNWRIKSWGLLRIVTH